MRRVLVPAAIFLLVAIATLFAQEPAVTATTANVVLTWTASTTAGVGYQVFRETESGICTPTTSGAGPRCLLLNATPITALTFTDAGVSTAATLWYVVRATNANGNSPYTNEVKVTFTVAAPPAAPTALTCTGSVAGAPPGTTVTVTCQ